MKIRRVGLRIVRYACLLVMFILFFAAGAGISSLRVLKKDVPSAHDLENFRPPSVTRLYDVNDSLLFEFYIEKRTPVPLDRVPKHLIAAVITIEDRRFYKHWGINLPSILRAALSNLRARRVVRGGSTITQQLARALFLTQEKTLVRKAKEALVAMEIERAYSKDKILEMYLNQIYFGQGAYGIESAARTYYDKDVSEVTLPEAALLAGIIRSPASYSPFSSPEDALRRRAVVLDAMVDAGAIDRRAAAQAKNAPLGVRSSGAGPANIAPYFVEEVRRFVEQKFGSEMLYREGVGIYTTLDVGMQRKAEKALEDWLSTYEKAQKFGYTIKDKGPPGEPWGSRGTSYLQDALVAIDPRNGYILAMIGGRNFRDSEFNRAMQAHRQPGSAFKPFLWGAAVEGGMTAADIVLDAPIVVQVQDSAYKPSNYDGEFLGPVTLREGLAHSRNLVAIRLIQGIGPDAVADYAGKIGIRSRLERVLSLALGSSTTTLLEITSAYGVFADQGVRVEPTMIRKIVGKDGHVIYEDLPYSERVLSPQEAYVMTSLLESVVNQGTGYGARQHGFTRPAGGKTGTTDDFTDTWFIGFTPDLVCGVWIGFDQMRRIAEGATGTVVALPAWSEFMKLAEEVRPVFDFAEPEGIVHARICTKTGLLATNLCPASRDEIFIQGTEPTEFCTAHKVGVDRILEDEYNFERLDRKSLESEELKVHPGTR